MCKSGLFAIIFLLIGFSSMGGVWYEGSVTLRSDVVLRGDISIEDGYNVILLKIGDEIQVVPAFKIAFLQLYDDVSGRHHKFVSLHVGIGPARAFQFFEILVDGEVSVLKKEVTAWYSVHLEVEDYEYFILCDNELMSISRFRKNIYPKLVKETEGALKRFVDDNNLLQYKLADVVVMIQFYNDWCKSPLQLARN